MTHEELLASLDTYIKAVETDFPATVKTTLALRAVVELHKPNKIPTWVPTERDYICNDCAQLYPCRTISAIEEQLK